jgi:hypothetical protein
MKGLGQWTRSLDWTRRAQLIAWRSLSKRRSLLSTKRPSSGSGESAAVHVTRQSFPTSGDAIRFSDNDPAVVRTVETLSVVGSDAPTAAQEKEARSSGGIPSR